MIVFFGMKCLEQMTDEDEKEEIRKQLKEIED